MKKAPAKSNPKAGMFSGRKFRQAVRKSGPGTFTVHERGGRIISRDADSVARTAASPAKPAVIAYDAEDIEEANRIGGALCRQHAR